MSKTNHTFYIEQHQKSDKEDDDAKVDMATVPAGTRNLVFSSFLNEYEWKDLLRLSKSPAKATIKRLYLGHDGVIYGDEKDIKDCLLSLPNLTEVHYCGYYAQYDDILEEMRGTFPTIEFIAIL